METDGGGYTYYAVAGGVSTVHYSQENSCTKIGLQLAAWWAAASGHSLYRGLSTLCFFQERKKKHHKARHNLKTHTQIGC